MPDPNTIVATALPVEAPLASVAREGVALVASARVVGADGKPAYRSTEFWLALAFKVICVAVMAWGMSRGSEDLVRLALECAGGSTVLYTVARTVAKRLPAPAAAP